MRNLLFFLQPIQSSYCQKTEFGRAFLHSTFFLEKSDSKILRIKDLFLYHFDLETKKLVNDCWFCWIYSPYQSLQPYLMLHCTFAHYNSATRTYLSFPKAQLYFSHLKYFIHHISSAIFTLYSILCLASFYHP